MLDLKPSTIQPLEDGNEVESVDAQREPNRRKVDMNAGSTRFSMRLSFYMLKQSACRSRKKELRKNKRVTEDC